LAFGATAVKKVLYSLNVSPFIPSNVLDLFRLKEHRIVAFKVIICVGEKADFRNQSHLFPSHVLDAHIEVETLPYASSLEFLCWAVLGILVDQFHSQ
jgi:hypothetical protein